jgi:tRNA-splicing endonuclease subunit Sen54
MPFDDDDNPLQAPTPHPNNQDGAAAAATSAEEAMEDEMPDYKLFMSMFDKRGVSSKTIRKGEKDFESHGTRAQDSVLETSRRAMEDVLSYTRVHRGDAWARGWYFPSLWTQQQQQDDSDGGDADEKLLLKERVVVVEHERGHWMKDLGRNVPGNSKENPGVGRLWLLPEEALHLVERGTLDLWWPDKTLGELLPVGGSGKDGTGPDDYSVGVPLSLEAAYSLLIGEDGERGKVSLPKYQVFTHLKRGGFYMLRAATQEPSSTESQMTRQSTASSLWQWLTSLIKLPNFERPRPYGPLVAPGLYRAYRPIYTQLLLVPRHKPSPIAYEHHKPQDPFTVFFHVWKAGGTPFSKRNPPPPDFRIAVADTDASELPTLEQIEALLESTPLDPPSANPAWKGPGRMYQRLKHGHRNVLVAVVDRGLVNFMRFGEGVFGDEVLSERFDNRGGGGRGGKRGGRGGGRGRGRGRARGGKR